MDAPRRVRQRHVAGDAYCWGSINNVGQLGTNDTTPQIAGWHACAVTSPTDVGCWGDRDNGTLGNGGTTSSTTPVGVMNLVAPTALATGGSVTDHDASCVIDRGDVRCWGNGYYGRLGQGTADSASTPVDVVGLPAAATEVTVGDDHACAALADGDMYCWGRGDSGQLGDGNGASSMTPVKVTIP